MRALRRSRLGAALVWTALVWASALQAQTEVDLRATGPVTINADRAEWEKGGAMVYSGKVRLESGDMKLQGERLQLRQFEGGDYEAHVSGGPATLDHAALPAGAEEARPAVSAQAADLHYDSRSDIVEVKGNALLTRGTDRIRGNSIRYDVARRRIEAAGGENGQVQIIIQPPPRKDAAPAPAPVTP
ncbi:MAG: lipopolysaccharide transport periplasmic protein LptA [Panacagrimonas sp.]